MPSAPQRRYPDAACKWEPAPQQVFIDGVKSCLEKAVAAHPVCYGKAWFASFPCPCCGFEITARIVFGPYLIQPVEGAQEPIDVVCTCTHAHEGRDDRLHPTGCGQRFRFYVDIPKPQKG